MQPSSRFVWFLLPSVEHVPFKRAKIREARPQLLDHGRIAQATAISLARPLDADIKWRA